MTLQPESTLMYREAAEAAEVVERQLAQNGDAVDRIAQRLREMRPRFITTVARGSSDHAASYAKYLFETRTGVVTASTGPSVFSVYRASMSLENSLCLLISQSGASPDLLAVARAASESGALVVAMVNVTDSPLAECADEVIALQAGPERSVAATKSFIASLAACIHLVSAWTGDEELQSALHSLPALLREAWTCDWSPAVEALAACNDLYVLGRGLGLGIACEAALKFKEVCGLHAEAFSSAEVLHGPVTIARENFPVLVLAQSDQTMEGTRALVDDLAERGAMLMTAGLKHQKAIELPSPDAHPVIEPLLRIQGFYRMANALALKRGMNPDSPPFLNKVTSTI
jgi:glucosamine--fructose-6-phosphate aminotransferase (isomerizing)